MFYSIYMIILTSVLLALSSLTVKADDTYNFYFQKAPGKNTVLQSSAGQTIESAPEEKPAIPGPTSSAPEGASRSSTNNPEPARPFHTFEIGVGYANFLNKGVVNTTSKSYYPQHFATSVIASGQLVLNAQYNATEVLGIEAGVYYLLEKNKMRENDFNYQFKPLLGQRSDFSGGLVITPYRPRISELTLALSAVGGAITIPRIMSAPTADEISHSSTFYYGARATFELKNIAVQFSVRGLGGYKALLANSSLAYLF